MDTLEKVITVGPFLGVTLGIFVLFIGKRLNDAFGFLREFNIPEPVTGGIIFSLLLGLIYALSGVTFEFDLSGRDFLLVYFFTTIGINASLQDLRAGGKPLVILLAITIGYMFVQNLLGVSVANLFSLQPAVGVLGGTVSLIGGHGTAIAWSPLIAERFQIENAVEIGVACATFGLILASLMGGPLARFLITKHGLSPEREEPENGGLSEGKGETRISYLHMLDAVLAIHICVILGFLLNEVVQGLGVKLPLFVSCLFAGIFLTNVIPSNFPRITGTKWPTRTSAIALIADISLSTFPCP